MCPAGDQRTCATVRFYFLRHLRARAARPAGRLRDLKDGRPRLYVSTSRTPERMPTAQVGQTGLFSSSSESRRMFPESRRMFPESGSTLPESGLLSSSSAGREPIFVVRVRLLASQSSINTKVAVLQIKTSEGGVQGRGVWGKWGCCCGGRLVPLSPRASF